MTKSGTLNTICDDRYRAFINNCVELIHNVTVQYFCQIFCTETGLEGSFADTDTDHVTLSGMHHTFNAVKITVEFTLKYWFKVGLHILSCYIYNVCDLLFASNFHLIKVRSDQLELMIFYFRGLFGTYQLEAVYSGSIELYLHITTTDDLTFISGGKCNRNRDFCYFDLNVAKFKTLLYGLFMVEN